MSDLLGGALFVLLLALMLVGLCFEVITTHGPASFCVRLGAGCHVNVIDQRDLKIPVGIRTRG